MRRRIVTRTALAAIAVSGMSVASAEAVTTIKAPPAAGGAVVAYTGSVHAIGAANFQVGPVTCSGLVAKGVVQNSNITAAYPTTAATVQGGVIVDPANANYAAMRFGVAAPNSSTLPAYTGTPPNATSPTCPGNVGGIANCVVQVRKTVTPAPLSGQAFDILAKANGIGVTPPVQIQFGPLVADLNCLGSGGGARFVCTYTSGTVSGGVGTPAPITSGSIASGSNSAVFSNQSVYRSAGSVACPATSAVNGTVSLYADNPTPPAGFVANALSDTSRPVAAY